jgi:cystathionine beta-lyase
MMLGGMETLGVRMQHSSEVAMLLIGRLQAVEVVERVLYPELPTDPG